MSRRISNSRCDKRNSNVELLRIIAMFLIVLNHFHWSVDAIVADGGAFERFSLLNAVGLLSNFGGVGDNLFFMISAWYMCEESVSIKRNLRRSWLLERQLLFYSIGLFFVETLMELWCNGFYSTSGIVKSGVFSLFPFLSGRWWYPTSYIIFLFIHPWLNEGLRNLGEMSHRNLLIISIALWGFIPYVQLNMGYSVMLFLYLYVITTYIRWYLLESMTQKMENIMLFYGLLLGIVSNFILQLFKPDSIVQAGWMNNPRCIPSLMVALGLVLKCCRKEVMHSRVINICASATLAAFLLIGFGSNLLEEYVFPVLHVGGLSRLLIEFCLAVLFFVLALAVDMARQAVFAITIDRNKAKLFDCGWNCSMRIYHVLTDRLMKK